MDPFSSDSNVRKMTQNVLTKTFEFVSDLEQKTQNPVGVVGSFSVVPGNIDDFYKRYAELIEEFNSRNRKMVLQWLPPVAWYFGGSVRLEVMNDSNAVKSLISNQIPIVMDTSHLLMGVNHFGIEALKTIETLGMLTQWYHISGASGIDGEGTSFEEMNSGETQMISKILKSGKNAVIEVWQGHLDQFAGFQVALETLERNFSGEIE
jgi:hypothetical protein